MLVIHRDICIILHMEQLIHMKKFDLIVIGSGSGMKIVWSAVNDGLNVALVEGGPLGGTCLNNGCIPSKIMIYPADVISAANDAKKLGIDLPVNRVDPGRIMGRVRAIIDRERRQSAEGNKVRQKPDLAHGDGRVRGRLHA